MEEKMNEQPKEEPPSQMVNGKDNRCDIGDNLFATQLLCGFMLRPGKLYRLWGFNGDFRNVCSNRTSNHLVGMGTNKG